MMSVSSRNKGLTLVELLFIVIIIGILIGISLPNFRRTFNSIQLANFSRELQSFMNYLSQRSVIERKVIYLTLDDENKVYRAQFKGEQERFKSYPIPKEIKFETENRQILFYPDGNIDKVTVKLINRDNRYIALTTKGVFGSVKVQSE